MTRFFRRQKEPSSTQRVDGRVFWFGSPQTARGSFVFVKPGRQRFSARVEWLSPSLP
jgi:hypothetical protein